MKVELNQASSWALAIFLSVVFFGVGVTMLLRVADRIAGEKTEHILNEGSGEETLRPDNTIKAEPEPNLDGSISGSDNGKFAKNTRKKKSHGPTAGLRGQSTGALWMSPT